MQSRYYNPDWGRFINADGSIGQTGELISYNVFAYCINNPINNQDPNGYLAYKIGCEVYGGGGLGDVILLGIYYLMGEASPYLAEANGVMATAGNQMAAAADKLSDVRGRNNSSSPDPKKGKDIVEKVSQIGNNSQIKNRALKDLTKKFGKKGVNEFTKAINKGLVSPNGQNGIKRLSANTKIGGKIYEFEVKVFGEAANYRLYGNYDKDTGTYIWDIFGKAFH